MNTRILELAEQAGYNPAWSTKADREEYLDMEKFAELIIKECIDLVEYNSHGAAKDIKEHFGVTE